MLLKSAFNDYKIQLHLGTLVLWAKWADGSVNFDLMIGMDEESPKLLKLVIHFLSLI